MTQIVDGHGAQVRRVLQNLAEFLLISSPILLVCAVVLTTRRAMRGRRYFIRCVTGLLSVVVLPATVKSVDNYALKDCTGLSEVYHEGSPEIRADIKEDISRDMPEFDSYGVIATGAPSPSSSTSTYVENADGSVTQSYVTVRQDDDMTLVAVVTQTTRPDASVPTDGYTASVTVTVENNNAWERVESSVTETLKTISDTYSTTSADSVSVDVHLREGGSVNGDFLEELEGRERWPCATSTISYGKQGIRK